MKLYWCCKCHYYAYETLQHPYKHDCHTYTMCTIENDKSAIDAKPIERYGRVKIL